MSSYQKQYREDRKMAQRASGFELTRDLHGRNCARFTCVECSETLDLTVTGGLNPEALANTAKHKGWDADSYQPQATLCPECKTKTPVHDTDSELKKTEARMATQPALPQPVVPIREATAEQRIAIRSLLEANFDEELGVYSPGFSDQHIAEMCDVPRIVVERIRNAAYGPIRVSAETVAVRTEIVSLTEKLNTLQRDADAWAQMQKKEMDEVRNALANLAKRVPVTT
jgi:hypothetical protein